MENKIHPKKKLDPYPVATCPKKPSNSADLRALKYQKVFSTPPAPREKKKKKRGDGGGGMKRGNSLEIVDRVRRRAL